MRQGGAGRVGAGPTGDGARVRAREGRSPYASVAFDLAALGLCGIGVGTLVAFG